MVDKEILDMYYDDIRGFKLLSREEETDLLKRVKKEILLQKIN